MMPHLAATYAEVKMELRQYLRNALDGKGRSRQRQLESQRSIDDESDTVQLCQYSIHTEIN